MKRYFLFILSSLVCYISMCGANCVEVNESRYLVLDLKSEIRYVDFGSSNLRGKKLSHSSMLAVKCVKEFAEETTISIVTANGKYHEFIVRYSRNPLNLVWSVSEDVKMPQKIELSTINTFHIIGHESISDILVGSDSIIADYADHIENIVKAKARYDKFLVSSLTLVTKDGNIYPFVVNYKKELEHVSLELDNNMPSDAIFNDAPVNDVKMEALGNKICMYSSIINDIGAAKQKMQFLLKGVYCAGDLMMFHLMLLNNNQIDYDIDFVKVYIQDKPRSRTIAVQEDEITPIHISYDSSSNHLLGGESRCMVLFFKRFTLPSKRVLCFEVFEKNGGRHLKFTMSDKEILKARILN